MGRQKSQNYQRGGDLGGLDCWGLLGTWHGWDRGNCWETVGSWGLWDWGNGQVKFLSLKMPGRTLPRVSFSKGESVG